MSSENVPFSLVPPRRRSRFLEPLLIIGAIVAIVGITSLLVVAQYDRARQSNVELLGS